MLIETKGWTMIKIHKPCENNMFCLDHARLLYDNFYAVTGRKLVVDKFNDIKSAKNIFESSIVIVSHDVSSDPIFNYANQAALDLFEMGWEEFTILPSRKSAERINRDERSRLLAEVADNGFIDNYTGVRISKTGKRFTIKNAIVWNLRDRSGVYKGQAAAFSEWDLII